MFRTIAPKVDGKKKTIIYQSVDEEWIIDLLGQEKYHTEWSKMLTQALEDIKLWNEKSPELKEKISNKRRDARDPRWDQSHVGDPSYFQLQYLNVRSDMYQLPVEEKQISRIKFDIDRNEFVGIEEEAPLDDN